MLDCLHIPGNQYACRRLGIFLRRYPEIKTDVVALIDEWATRCEVGLQSCSTVDLLGDTAGEDNISHGSLLALRSVDGDSYFLAQRRFFEELDYVHEGNNATLFAASLCNDLPQARFF